MNIFNFFKRKKNEFDYNFLYNLPEEQYECCLKKIYYSKTGLKLNLKNPKRFNEKLQYLKLFDNMAEKSVYTDKITVRDYFKLKTGSSGHLKELLGVYNSFDEIDFSILPEKFLIQVNHGSKMLFKIKNKSLMLEKSCDALKKRFNDWLGYNFAFCAGFELQYKNIKPEILIEKLYENSNNAPIQEIMFFCFDGQPEFIETIVSSNIQGEKNKNAFYNLNWQVYNECCMENLFFCPIDKPVQLNEMLEMSKKLAEGFKFVRVDFMLVNSEFYFLELTFTPNSGFVRFIPDKYDFYFGKYLKL